MIQKVVKKAAMQHFSEVRDNLAYWRSKTPEERLSAVEYLRRQQDGGSARLQKTVRVIQRSQS